MSIVVNFQTRLKNLAVGDFIERFDRRVQVNDPAHSNARYALFDCGNYYTSTNDEEIVFNFIYELI